MAKLHFSSLGLETPSYILCLWKSFYSSRNACYELQGSGTASYSIPSGDVCLLWRIYQTCLQLILRSQHQPSLTPNLSYPSQAVVHCVLWKHILLWLFHLYMSPPQQVLLLLITFSEQSILPDIYLCNKNKHIFVEYWIFETDFIWGYSVKVSFRANWRNSRGIFMETQVHGSFIFAIVELGRCNFHGPRMLKRRKPN